jgi:carbon-monoxide dehydrogenase medium subunit
VIPAPFEYVRAGSVEEALEALADPEAKVLAGGHSLVPVLKLRLVRPSLLVDVGRLPLRGVAREDGVLRVGALTTYDELLRADGVPDALREAAASVGDLQVRNRGTIGGGLAHGDPASDVAAAALALGARLRARSPEGERELPADGFFIGPYTTALAQQELVVELVFEAGGASAYASVEDPASGYPLAGAAVRLGDGRATVGLTGVAAAPRRLEAVEERLAGGATPSVDELEELLGDVEAGGGDLEHRRRLAAVVVARAAAQARERA